MDTIIDFNNNLPHLSLIFSLREEGVCLPQLLQELCPLLFPRKLIIKKRGNPQKSDKQRVSLMSDLNKLFKIFHPVGASDDEIVMVLGESEDYFTQWYFSPLKRCLPMHFIQLYL